MELPGFTRELSFFFRAKPNGAHGMESLAMQSILLGGRLMSPAEAQGAASGRTTGHNRAPGPEVQKQGLGMGEDQTS